MMNILITGGAGFIGSHTADALLAQDHRIRILDNLSPTVHPKGLPPYISKKIEFIEGDVTDKSMLQKALQGIEVVYHFAAYQDYLPEFSSFFRVNTQSTALLYEILVETKQPISRVIVATSQAIMGEGLYSCPHCFPETNTYLYPAIRSESQLKKRKWNHLCSACGAILHWQPSDESVVHPFNPYALSKHAQEQIALSLGNRYHIPTVVLRYSIVQGSRQSFYNAYSGAMRIFALSLFLQQTPIVYEDGKQIRDFININDAVAANTLVLTHPAAIGKTFNVGGGIPWTVNEFYETMQRVVGHSIEPIQNEFYRFGDTRHIFSDTGALQQLGWSPRFTVEDSIRAYWAYLEEQKNTDDILAYANAQMKKLEVVRRVSSP